MATSTSRGPKAEAAKGVRAAQADGRLAAKPKPKKAATSSPAYKLIRDAGATPAQLSRLRQIYSDGLSWADLTLFASHLLMEALEAMSLVPAEGVVAPMARAKAMVQYEKALESLRRIVEAQQAPQSKNVQVVMRVGFRDQEARKLKPPRLPPKRSAVSGASSTEGPSCETD